MVELVSMRISVDEILQQLEDQTTGAVVLFLGRVRNLSEGHEVIEMDYEAYPEMALKKMQEIETQMLDRWPVNKVVLVHRVGKLALGEVSVAVAVTSAHRNEAFAACRFAIDTLKETVPIWKKEYSPDGERWVEGVMPSPE